LFLFQRFFSRIHNYSFSSDLPLSRFCNYKGAKNIGFIEKKVKQKGLSVVRGFSGSFFANFLAFSK